MGSGSDFIFGGLLSGVGKGMEAVEVSNRQAALERLRQQHETTQAETAYERTMDRDKQQAGYALERQEVEGEQAVERLGVAGEIQTRRDQSQQAHELRVTSLRAQLEGANNRAEIALRDRLDDADVRDVVVDEEGNYVIVRNDGTLESSTVRARAQASQTEGGRLTEAEQDTAYQADRRAWVAGGRQGAAPERRDYIGMSRQDYHSRRGGGGAAPTRVIQYDRNGRRVGG